MDQYRRLCDGIFGILKCLSAFPRPLPWLTLLQDCIEWMQHSYQIGEKLAAIVDQAEKGVKLLHIV